MKYLLDTNTCIRFLNQRSLPVITRLKAEDERSIALCSVVKAELYFGALKSSQPDEALRIQRAFASRFVSLPFDDDAAEIYGRIRALLSRAGTPIGPNDLFIAAIALSNRLVLVTHNTREFERVPALMLEDWES